jgi:outer membrane protein insertion porin family
VKRKISDKALKNNEDTKTKNPIRILKASKFIKAKYKTDLEKVMLLIRKRIQRCNCI